MLHLLPFPNGQRRYELRSYAHLQRLFWDVEVRYCTIALCRIKIREYLPTHAREIVHFLQLCTEIIGQRGIDRIGTLSSWTLLVLVAPKDSNEENRSYWLET